ncbi:MAG: adenylate/guanylate cyclase domain-containing protein [Pseudobdellovibrionaceae bacterium]
MRISISTKLIIMTIGFLAATTFNIGFSNSREIENRVLAREKDFNQEKAHAKTLEVRALLGSLVDRVQALGKLSLQASQESKEIEFAFEKEKNLVSLTIYQVKNGQLIPSLFKTKKSFLESHQLDSKFFSQLREKIPFPIQTIIEKRVAIRNSSLPKLPPLITIGVPLTRDEKDQVSHIALADIGMGVLQSAFSEKGTRNLFLTDEKGLLLSHQNEAKALARLSLAQHPLMEAALKQGPSNLQKEYLDPESDREVIGAFVKIPEYGVIVVSEIDRSVIQEAVGTLVSSVIETAGIHVSVAIFLIFLFSMTLTKPIERLAELIQHVSKGNFEVKARAQIRSRDEVGELARAFDKMTLGLKERDKVKSLFSKFHGSKVAEDILKNNIGVGGQNKEVTVFFSDIRGFTDFSDQHAPEEVVEMLNEYFEIMVRIINRNHGVVDKFIGDAIMAVWGAPQSSEKDTSHALKACLEMRQALAALNNKREARGQMPLLIGMGLHTGPVISGTIGSTERLEYTVIGDTVNLTSRIESATKEFGLDLLVSESIYTKLQTEFLMEPIGEVQLRGKSEPMNLYKVLAYKSPDGEWIEVKTSWSDYGGSEAA